MSDPTVGDLLAAADRDARALLGNAEPHDGPSLAAGWAAVLGAAYNVLTAIPGPPTAGPALTHDPGDHLTIRVAQMTQHVRLFKPLHLDPHPSTTRIVQAWQQTATLLNRHAHPGLATTRPARQDAAAARVRVARTLAVVAHVTGRELQGYIRQIQATEQPQHRIPAREVSITPLHRQWIPMLQRQEHQALDYLTGHRGDLDGEHRALIPDADALHTTVAAWSTQVIRCASGPGVSATDLQHIAYTQNAILNAAAALTAAAIEQGELATGSGPHLLHRLDEAAAAWATVAGQWTWARTPDAPRSAPETTSGSAAILGAIEATARAGAAWASPADITDRLHGAPILPMLRTITEGSDVLADIYAHLPDELRTTDRLRAPARILLQISTENYAVQQARTQPDANVSPDTLTVPMHDVTRNRLLPMTPAAQERLANAGSELADTAHRASQALLAASPPRHAPCTTATQDRPPSTASRRHSPAPAPDQGIPR